MRPLVDAAVNRYVDRQVATKSRSVRRLNAASLLERFFPYTLDRQNDGLTKAENLLRSGTGLVFVAPHASLGDSNRLLEMLLIESPLIREREIVIPVAAHQKDSNFLPQLSRLAGLRLSPVVTQDTLEKEGDLARRGRPIPWEHHEQGHGNLSYLKTAADVLKGVGGNLPGVAVVFPQAGRRSDLSSWENGGGTPIATTDKFLQRRNTPVAYVFVGMDLEANDYTSKRTRRLNAGKTYKFRIEDVVTSAELNAQALANGITLDEQARQYMLKVAPEAYKPK